MDSNRDNVYQVTIEASDDISTGVLLVVTIIVTDEDEPLSSDATLSSLMLSDGMLMPAFDADGTSYTASVANSVSQVTVTATSTDATHARIAFLNASDMALEDADGVTEGHQVSLAVGENIIKVKVTAEDGSTMQTYTIRVTRVALPVVTIAAVRNTVPERVDEVVEFTLTRTGGDPSQPLVVTVNIKETQDFLSVEGYQTVTFAGGETEKVFGATGGIRTSMDLDPDGAVTAVIVAGADYQIGDPSTATVTVEDSGLEVTLSISVSPSTASEGHAVTATVTATTNKDQNWFEYFSVLLATQDGTAVGQSDYQENVGLVDFGSGAGTRVETAPGSGTYVYEGNVTRDIRILDDAVVEPEEQFNVRVASNSNPPAYKFPSDRTTATITITDGDEPTWTVSVDPATIAEDGGSSTVTVRTGGVTFSEARTIVLNFTGSTATETTDYTVASDMLTLAAGDSLVTTTVAGVDDSLADPGDAIKVAATLDGAQIGEQQTITIIGRRRGGDVGGAGGRPGHDRGGWASSAQRVDADAYRRTLNGLAFAQDADDGSPQLQRGSTATETTDYTVAIATC